MVVSIPLKNQLHISKIKENEKKLGSIISKFVDFSPKNDFWYGPNRILMNYVF